MGERENSIVCLGGAYGLDVSPFSAETLWEGGRFANWKKLRQILEPIISRDFAVTDVTTQAFVDDVRGLLDSSTDENGNTDGILATILRSEADGDGELLKAVLAVGADPDLPKKNNMWRASHMCSWLGRIDAAAVVFACRPDMAAINFNHDTPLAASQREVYQGDEERPARRILRAEVAKMIIDAKYNEWVFPSIAELSCRQKWFAVRNLIRREVVPASEYLERYHGKLAVEWARVHEAENVAKEIEYFATPAKVRLREAAKVMEKKVAEKEEEILELKIRIEKDVSKSTELLEMKNLMEELTKKNVNLEKEVEELKTEVSDLKKVLAEKEAATRP